MKANHKWKFYRLGGVDQVILRDGDDLRNLGKLDLKLWMVLAMPLEGVNADKRTLELLDTDKNRAIHPNEICDAVEWVCNNLKKPEIIFEDSDSVDLDQISNDELVCSARRVLANLHKGDAKRLTFGDVADRAAIFAQTLFNGDGVVTSEASESDDDARQFIELAVKVTGGATDRSGKQGINSDNLEAFVKSATAIIEWKSLQDKACPAGQEAAAKASAAVAAVREKIDDYFARCSLAAFDARALDALNRDPEDYKAVAGDVLTGDNESIASFPLAVIAADKPLPLGSGTNPAWAAKMRAFADDAVKPLLKSRKLGDAITEGEWREICAAIAPYDDWQKAKPEGTDDDADVDTLRRMVDDKLVEKVKGLLAKDVELTPESEALSSVEKLMHYRRDLGRILRNYVNFVEFYGSCNSTFQSGTLFIDGKACGLSLDMVDPGKHATMAPLSGFNVLFCDIRMSGAVSRKIAVAVTNGSGDNIMPGRNGVFFDRKGNAWDATVASVVPAPISVHEAFWAPYKKLNRFIEEQISKRASAADNDVMAKMNANAEKAVATTAGEKPAEGAPQQPKKIDLGTIALIGTVVGGLGALLGGFLKALFGLGWWIPLGVLGIILLISGPSMLLAAIKLRKRNIAPLLDANGWAINTQARVNTIFGARLTKLAKMPRDAVPMAESPIGGGRRAPTARLLFELALLLALTVYFLYVKHGYFFG